MLLPSVSSVACCAQEKQQLTDPEAKDQDEDCGVWYPELTIPSRAIAVWKAMSYGGDEQQECGRGLHTPEGGHPDPLRTHIGGHGLQHPVHVGAQMYSSRE